MRFILVLGSLCASLHIAAAVDFDTLRPIGPVSRVTRSAKGVQITSSDGAGIAIEILASDLVRVRATPKGPIGPAEHSWAVAKSDWTLAAFEFQENANVITLRTAAVSVSVNRDPLLISFSDPKTGAVWNADYRPMLFAASSGGVGVQKKLGFDEHFYGLGEKAAPLDKRRGRYTMWNTDAYRYALGTDPIYQSIPFYIGWQDGSAYGLYFDNSFRSSFDFGSSSEEAVTYTADGGPLTYYFFAGPSMKSILGRYTELTGRIPLPPRWTLGHQQSRYTYYPDSEVMKIAQMYRDRDLPLDAIHLDINYMDGYRDFTFDPRRFPDPAKLIDGLARQGVKIVTIVDPGIKLDPGGYRPYAEGLQKGFFLKRMNGNTYVGKVWPGDAVFVDYTNPDAAAWWGNLLKFYTDKNVAGIWTDMNEPSDFVDETGASQTDVVSFDAGRHSRYAENRNLFALQMAKATFEGLQRLRPDDRPYVITRAGFAGIQRYSTMWAGDNTATWESLTLSLPMFESLGLSGESFVGADVGGFAGNTNAELLTRWYQVGFLTPFFRNHGEMGTYDHEPWRFGPYYEDIIRKYIKLRYRLLPFLYTALAEARRTGLPLIRPLLLEYQNDRNVINLEDEFMVGDDLLAAPVTKPDVTTRRIYLPPGTWYNFWTDESVPGARWLNVPAPLEEVPLFVRAGAVIPMGPEMRWSDEKLLDPLTFRIYPDQNGEASGTVYEDDGKTPAYEQGVFRRTTVRASTKAGSVSVEVSAPEGRYAVPARRLDFLTPDKKSASIADTGKASAVTLR